MSETHWFNFSCNYCNTSWRVLLSEDNKPILWELVDTLGKSAKRHYEKGSCKCYQRATRKEERTALEEILQALKIKIDA